MWVQLVRTVLHPLYEAASDVHPGLLLQRGLVEHDEKHKEAKTEHVKCVVRRSNVRPFYRRAYARWRNATADQGRFRTVKLRLKTRLFIGLTGGGMLETGCLISHSYGTPYLPGSSVKGIVASHARDRLGEEGRAFHDELFGAATNDDTDDPPAAALSGLITFHDAWWVPDSAERPLVQEVVTSHHPAYYGNDGTTAATDFDSPVPNAQIAAHGAFLFVIGGPVAWLGLVQQMLTSALTERGAGARTRGGYGLFAAPEPAPDPGREWVDTTIRELSAKPGVQAEQVLRGRALAEAWSSIDAPSLKQAAHADIRRRWQANGWWDAPQGGSARKAKAIYDGYPPEEDDS